MPFTRSDTVTSRPEKSLKSMPFTSRPFQSSGIGTDSTKTASVAAAGGSAQTVGWEFEASCAGACVGDGGGGKSKAVRVFGSRCAIFDEIEEISALLYYIAWVEKYQWGSVGVVGSFVVTKPSHKDSVHQGFVPLPDIPLHRWTQTDP